MPKEVETVCGPIPRATQHPTEVPHKAREGGTACKTTRPETRAVEIRFSLRERIWSGRRVLAIPSGFSQRAQSRRDGFRIARRSWFGIVPFAVAVERRTRQQSRGTSSPRSTTSPEMFHGNCRSTREVHALSELRSIAKDPIPTHRPAPVLLRHSPRRAKALSSVAIPLRGTRKGISSPTLVRLPPQNSSRKCLICTGSTSRSFHDGSWSTRRPGSGMTNGKGCWTPSTKCLHTIFSPLERRGIRFFRLGTEPPVRGTVVETGAATTSFSLVATFRFSAYPGLRVPNPIEVLDISEIPLRTASFEISCPHEAQLE